MDFSLPHYCHISSSNKYEPQMPHICISTLLNVHQCGKYANIYATYELTGINIMMNSTVHGRQ